MVKMLELDCTEAVGYPKEGDLDEELKQQVIYLVGENKKDNIFLPKVRVSSS